MFVTTMLRPKLKAVRLRPVSYTHLGLNRRTFEDILVKNLRRGLSDIGKFEIKNAQSTLTVIPVEEEVDLEAAAERASKVFGIAALSRACVVEKDMDAILQAAGEYLSLIHI